jgi:hypothetical protein
MTNKEVIALSKAKVNKRGKPFGGKRIPKQLPKTVFTVTAIGLAKCESGKYKSRWCKPTEFHYPTMKNGKAI